MHNEITDFLGIHLKEPVIYEHSENQTALSRFKTWLSPQETALFDIRVTDNESKYYSLRKPEYVLECCADEGKDKVLSNLPGEAYRFY